MLTRYQQTLHNASMEDFMILEYRDTIGGRAWHKPFGQDKDGNPYIIEMGCNWVCHSLKSAFCTANNHRSKDSALLGVRRTPSGHW